MRLFMYVLKKQNKSKSDLCCPVRPKRPHGAFLLYIVLMTALLFTADFVARFMKVFSRKVNSNGSVNSNS